MKKHKKMLSLILVLLILTVTQISVFAEGTEDTGEYSEISIYNSSFPVNSREYAMAVYVPYDESVAAYELTISYNPEVLEYVRFDDFAEDYEGFATVTLDASVNGSLKIIFTFTDAFSSQIIGFGSLIYFNVTDEGLLGIDVANSKINPKPGLQAPEIPLENYIKSQRSFPDAEIPFLELKPDSKLYSLVDGMFMDGVTSVANLLAQFKEIDNENAEIWLMNYYGEPLDREGEYVANGSVIVLDYYETFVDFYAFFLFGDVNLDGMIKPADARQALRCAVGIDSADDFMVLTCDVNFDGAVKPSDARKILRVAVGIDTYADIFNNFVEIAEESIASY